MKTIAAKERRYVKLMHIIRKKNSRRGAENRAQGEAFEFRILRKFKVRSDVLWAIRSAGSHSIIDLVIQYKNGKQLWVTAKSNHYIEPSERRELERAVECKPGNVEIREYYYSSPKKMHYRVI